MIEYTPNEPPTDINQLASYLRDELNKISLSLRYDSDTLIKKNVAPDKPRDGDLAYADGTNWDPGSGIGIYYYKGSTSAWVFLG